jgi:ribonucleotide reductase alpha subunit
MKNKPWSNLSRVVYKRTYSRNDTGVSENWSDTVDRVIVGNTRNHDVSAKEKQRLRFMMLSRKAIPAGRGLWYSGSPGHARLGGVANNNCWFVTLDDWYNYIIAQDLLMLGGGVGASVEHRFVSKLPRVRKGVIITHQFTKDADFIVPDSREGWNQLTYRILESFFVTGKSFTYSTICVRALGEPIKGFGGISSGPRPLVSFVEKLCAVLVNRQGCNMRPIDAVDILCSIGELVVSGNVRRSALILMGDPFDKEYLKAKRWDLGGIPTQRAMANFSVICDDIDDLHPLFWATYENGEPFGIINRTNIRKFGRMGELKKDSAMGVNPCGEATLENAEPCNLQELALPNFTSVEELEEAARLMHRYGKRVTCDPYHQPKCDEVVKRNRRIGTGITGCLEAPEFFNPEILDRVYDAIQEENVNYSKELGIPESIRTTVIKPSGSVSKLLDVRGEGIHPGFSRYMIQRIRFAANDPMIPKLREAGHHIEPVIRFDGTLDQNTLVVDFYIRTPDTLPVADEGYDTWKQLEAVKMAQKHWADQSISVTVYYKKNEIQLIKDWLKNNLKEIKTISFLCHNDHGFIQAPKEKITQEQFEELSKNIKDLDTNDIASGDLAEAIDCDSGACPIK